MSAISFKNHGIKLKYGLNLLEEDAELSEERKISVKQWLCIKLHLADFWGSIVMHSNLITKIC